MKSTINIWITELKKWTLVYDTKYCKFKLRMLFRYGNYSNSQFSHLLRDINKLIGVGKYSIKWVNSTSQLGLATNTWMIWYIFWLRENVNKCHVWSYDSGSLHFSYCQTLKQFDSSPKFDSSNRNIFMQTFLKWPVLSLWKVPVLVLSTRWYIWSSINCRKHRAAAAKYFKRKKRTE